MRKKYIIALDEGTTSARTLVYDCEQEKIVNVVSKSFKQIYPQPGWVEHNPEEIWQAQLNSFNEAIEILGLNDKNVYSIGVTNQRETVVVWNKNTGIPVYNAIVWQCRRTAPFCEELVKNGYTDLIKKKTGLVVDAYFSASKIKWILENVPGVAELAKKGEILAGTIDSFLVWKLTKGEVFVTDYSNASRTMLFNIHTLQWDAELLSLFNIPKEILPKVVNSSHKVGIAKDYNMEICGIAGDQQASLFGQGCYDEGMAKNTYGTGCFMLMNTGNNPISSDKLLTTIAWGLDGRVTYALEGSIFNAGSVVQWLRDEMNLIEKASDTEDLCFSVKDTNGVYFVPAFTGLGAPYWCAESRGIISGLTRGCNKAHIVRAGMESMCYNTKAIIESMENYSNISLKELRCDGGVSKDNFLMQFQADMLDCTTSKQKSSEITAMGVVYLAGLASGAFKSLNQIKSKIAIIKTFNPSMEKTVVDKFYLGWKKAVSDCISINK